MDILDIYQPNPLREIAVAKSNERAGKRRDEHPSGKNMTPVAALDLDRVGQIEAQVVHLKILYDTPQCLKRP